MVLPLVVASGLTFVAVTVKSGIRAWVRYTRLHKVDIANLNDIDFISANQFRARTSDQLSNDPNTQKHMKIMHYLHEYQGGFYPTVNKEESLLIFNFKDLQSALINEKMIKSRHRQLMFLNHPDRNGSPLLASKINEAKDILLQYYSHR
ncbi:hypothetical protein ACO0RG_000365 [Hanseniaspora osmophila]|uniref:Mitochondrial DnaJ 2 n=1 Tax=Hanseniaspora osmophila TaxID=56408 RepID=A0A1E5R6G7_9ASCO|nr:Mitochondrial DnaJ 2 [Hanseniaspora osmophila]